MIIINGKRMKNQTDVLDLCMRIGARTQGPMIIGMDTGNYNHVFSHLIISGLLSAGIDVISIGTVPYPVAAYVMKRLSGDGLIYFQTRNKNVVCTITDERTIPINIKTLPEPDIGYKKPGKYDTYSRGLEDYKIFLEKQINEKQEESKPKRTISIIIDAGYGTASEVYKFFDEEIKYLHGKPGEPLPFKSDQRINALKTAVSSFDADLGIMFDSSCIRVLFIDNKRNMITQEQLISLFKDSLIIHDRRILSLKDVKNKLSDNVLLDAISLKGYGFYDDYKIIPEGAISYDPILFTKIILNKLAKERNMIINIPKDYSIRKEEIVSTNKLPDKELIVYNGNPFAYVEYFESPFKDPNKENIIKARVVVKGNSNADMDKLMNELLNKIKEMPKQ